jgi:replicative DNA helicase
MEEAVLGALLHEPHLMDRIITILKAPSYFYTDAHQSIYEALRCLHDRCAPIDELTVCEELKKLGKLETAGGIAYLSELAFKASSSANIEAHAFIIVEKFLKREMIRICGQVIGDAYNDSTDAFELMNLAETELFDIRHMSIRKEVVGNSRVVANVLKEMDELAAQNKTVTGVRTGNSDMDEVTKGWQPGLIILAARPSVGKTAYALNIAFEALKNGDPVAFFSLETIKETLVKRMLSAGSRVPFERVKIPSLQTPDEKQRLIAEANKQARFPIFWDDTPGLSLPELRSKARELKSKHNIRLLIIDYLQLMEGDTGNSQFRENEIAKISRGLKKLAMELQIPIIALSQLNRTVEGRAVRTYKLSDLRESGAIEQDADMVMFLHVPEKEDYKDKNTAMHTAGVFIEKQRDGKKDKVAYVFHKDIQRWEEYVPFAEKPKQQLSNHPPPVKLSKEQEQQFQKPEANQEEIDPEWWKQK